MLEIRQAIIDHLQDRLRLHYNAEADVEHGRKIHIRDYVGNWADTLTITGHNLIIEGHCGGGTPEDDQILDLNDPNLFDQLDAIMRIARYYDTAQPHP